MVLLKGKVLRLLCHTLVNHIEEGFLRKEYTGAIFLDIAGAFVNAWGSVIIAFFLKKGRPIYLVKLNRELVIGGHVFKKVSCV